MSPLQLDLSISTVILAGATLFGAIMGSFATLINRWLNRRASIRNLRRALLAEMESQYTLESVSEEDAFRLLRHEFPISIYESNVSQIGDLTQEEVELVVNFYSLLKELEQELERGGSVDYDFVQSVRTKKSEAITAIRQADSRNIP